MNVHDHYMGRCIELARRGAGLVAPNPMVGAVLVYQDTVIGEGWHERYGQAHAEVNCVASVGNEDRHLIRESTLYVSLEPCSHFGKTPPCTNLIIDQKIPRVVIGTQDPFPQVNGKGIDKLQASGVEVVQGVLESESKELNRRFFTFQRQHRPYVILKWAETGDRKIAGLSHAAGKRLLISNHYSSRLVHRWRSEEAAILVGTRTALLDDPSLTTREWPGPSAMRVIVDMDLSLPSTLKVFDKKVRTIVINARKHEESADLSYYQVTRDVSLIPQILNAMYTLGIQSVLVEGGGRLLQSFINEGMWDEARIIRNLSMKIGEGLPAPVLDHAVKQDEEILDSDLIEYYVRKSESQMSESQMSESPQVRKTE